MHAESSTDHRHGGAVVLTAADLLDQYGLDPEKVPDWPDYAPFTRLPRRPGHRPGTYRLSRLRCCILAHHARVTP